MLHKCCNETGATWRADQKDDIYWKQAEKKVFCTELQGTINNKIMEFGRLSSLLLLITCFCISISAKQLELSDQELQDLINNHEAAFKDFKAKCKKRYSNPSQELYRNLVHFRNQKTVKTHNLKTDKTYIMELNEFADLDEHQFKAIYATLIIPDSSVRAFAKDVAEKISLEREDCSCKMENQLKQLQLKARLKTNKDSVNKQKIDFYSTRTLSLREAEEKALNFPKEILSLKEDQYEIVLRNMDPNRPAYKKTTNQVQENKPPSTIPPPPPSLSELFNQKSTSPQEPQISITPAATQTISSISSPKVTDQTKTETVQTVKDKKTQQTNISPIFNQTETLASKSVTQANQQQAKVAQQNYRPNLEALPNNLQSAKVSIPSVPTNNQPVLSQIQLQLQKNDKIKQVSIGEGQRRLLATDLSQYNVDWTYYAGDVRNQGLCGACYAFAAIQNLQTVLAIYAFGSPIELSVQQIIDCGGSTNLTLGCNGGYLEGSFVFLKNFGATTSYSYPYTSGSTGSPGNCQNQHGYFKIVSYKALPFRDCMAVRTVLKKKPVSVAIASYRLQFYKTGVFTDCNTYLDHAVLLVGYQYNKGWKIKNSWGTSWGMGGFAWLADGNSCSLCDYPMVPKIELEPVENP